MRLFHHSDSARTARKRLLSVVSRDRADLPGDFLLRVTADLINTLLRYAEPDCERVSVTVERDGGRQCLCARFPVMFFKNPT